MSNEEKAMLNIGALSTATGVPVETIRTWERRYGFPESGRNDAGHRIYDLEMIEHLRLITTILSQGYRPSQLEGRTREQLQDLLEISAGHGEVDSEAEAGACGEWAECWMEAVLRLDREQFEGYLGTDFNRHSVFDFFTHRLQPFLSQVGRAWADGEINIFHEHFASECIREFLIAAWRPLNDRAAGSPVALATLSGERHTLGLYMVATVVGVAGRPALFLGANTPVDEIVSAAQRAGVTAVAISISEHANTAESIRSLTRLREALDASVEILVGGRGAPTAVTGVITLDDLEEIYHHLEE